MKPHLLLILSILIIGIAFVSPVIAYGPDYGTTYKSGYTYVADTIGLDYIPGPIAGRWFPWSIYEWDIRYNGTTKPYPNILWVYDATLANSTGAGSFESLPPVLESKVKYYYLGNHGFTIKYKFYKYMDRPDLGSIQGNLYGNIEYVDYPYLNTLASEVVFTPTVMYDNITCYPSFTGCMGSVQGVYYGNEMSMNHTAQGSGFAIQRHSSNEVMFSVSGEYFYSSFSKWKTLYQVWNDLSDFSKFLVVNRTTEYTQITKVRLYQGLNITWESPYDVTNLSVFLSNSTGRIVVNASGWQEQTIWDDNTSYELPPPPEESLKYWIYTFDETTGNFLANTNISLFNLTSGTAYNLLTNGYGMLQVSGILGDAHTSRGSKTNYISSDWSNQTVSGDTAAVQLMLWPVGVPPGGNCTVYWKVYDGTATPYQPVSGATIRISDGSVLLTDSVGTAQQNLLAWGNYTYSVEKIGFSGITRDLQPEGSTTFTQTIYLSKPAGVTPAPGIYDMNIEIGKLVDWIASTIFTLGVLIWCTLIFTVIGMFMLALRSIGGGSGTLFRTGLFPKNLFGRGGGRRGR